MTIAPNYYNQTLGLTEELSNEVSSLYYQGKIKHKYAFSLQEKIRKIKDSLNEGITLELEDVTRE